MSAPELKPFCELEVHLGPIHEAGEVGFGRRRIIPIIGGTVTGRITGTVLGVGADWQTVMDNGAADIDTRYALRTDDGAVIEIVNRGVRHGPPEVLAALGRGEEVDPALYYFRTTARLETGDPRHAWVNTRIFVGTGRRKASAVLMTLYEVM